MSESSLSMDPSQTSDVSSGIQRLLIVRLGAMGDIIHTLPAVTALRIAFPETMIGWVVEERWAELLCALPTPRSGTRSPQRPLVDRIHTVNTAKWRKAMISLMTLQEMATALSEIRAPQYEVAIDFQGAARSALIARWSGARTIYGFAQPRENIASMFYTRRVFANGEHIVDQNFSLAEAMAGKKLSMPIIDFPKDEAVTRDCSQLLQQKNIGDYVIMNPGAGWGAKRWPTERYGEVARQLAKDGLKVWINFGPGEESLMRTVEAASGGTAEGLECSLSQLVAFTRNARLFIGGDTGPMHLAAAQEVPVVAIFGPTNPARNGPYGSRNLVLRSSSSVTSHARRPNPEAGLLEITSEQVVAAAKQLLGSSHG